MSLNIVVYELKVERPQIVYYVGNSKDMVSTSPAIAWMARWMYVKFLLSERSTHAVFVVWNFIGGIGFTACGALGFAAKVNSGVNFQSVLCTFWGSWAFLIGSLLQWFESVNAV